MNKKGMTLVEIIISIVLISIVLIFLFSLLITVKDINDESEVNSTYLINKSLILKNIEEDFDKSNKITFKQCSIPSGKKTSIASFYEKYDEFYENSMDDDKKKYQCLEFTFAEDEANKAYLAIYYYESKSSYVISYIHGDVKATRLLPQYEDNDFNIRTASGSDIINTWKCDEILIDSSLEYNLADGNFHVINIPIIGPDNKDYSINISYYN